MNEEAQFRLGAAETLLDYLCGSWTVERSLYDHASGLSGAFTGVATFTPNDHGLRHSECGTLSWAGAPPTPATRDLVWLPGDSATAAEVHFADGRPFHPVDFGRGKDSPVHYCMPDVYHGEFVLLERARWHYTWRVAGPEKKLTLASRLTRTI